MPYSLGNNKWILPASIVSSPFSCFSYVQELLWIFCCGVPCFVDSFFGRLFLPTFQVSPVLVPSKLGSSRRHMFSDVNVEGCFLGMLELGVFPGLVGSYAFSPFYQFGITAWN